MDNVITGNALLGAILLFIILGVLIAVGTKGK